MAQDDFVGVDYEEQSLNLRAVVGMTVATLIAMVALFIVPWVQAQGAFSVQVAFAVLSAVEGGMALVVIYFLNQMFTERSYE